MSSALRIFDPGSVGASTTTTGAQHGLGGSRVEALPTEPPNQSSVSVGAQSKTPEGPQADGLTVSEIWLSQLRPALAKNGQVATIREYQTAVNLWRTFWAEQSEGQPTPDSGSSDVKLGSLAAGYDRPSVLQTEGLLPSLTTLQAAPEPPAANIVARDLQRFQKWLNRSTREFVTVNKRVASIQTIMREGAKEGHCQGAPALSKLSCDETAEPVCLTEQEVNSIYQACKVATWPEYSYDVTGQRVEMPHSASWYWRWLIVWLYNYGARVQDFASYETRKPGLQWDAVRFDSSHPTRAGRKGELDCRYGWFSFVPTKTQRVKKKKNQPARKLHLPMNEATKLHLAALKPNKVGGAIFACPNNKKRFYATWKSIIKASRVTLDEDVDPKGRGVQLKHFRETCATVHYEHSTASVASKILGHSMARGEGSATTQKHYISYEKRVLEAVQNLPQPESFWDIKDRSQKTLPFFDP